MLEAETARTLINFLAAEKARAWKNLTEADMARINLTGAKTARINLTEAKTGRT